MFLDKQNTSISTITECDVVGVSSVEFWSSLILENLAVAQVIVIESNDGEGTVLAIDEEVLNAPRRKSARDALAHEVAAKVYPDLAGHSAGSLAAVIKYEKNLVMLRSM